MDRKQFLLERIKFEEEKRLWEEKVEETKNKKTVSRKKLSILTAFLILVSSFFALVLGVGGTFWLMHVAEENHKNLCSQEQILSKTSELTSELVPLSDTGNVFVSKTKLHPYKHQTDSNYSMNCGFSDTDGEAYNFTYVNENKEFVNATVPKSFVVFKTSSETPPKVVVKTPTGELYKKTSTKQYFGLYEISITPENYGAIIAGEETKNV